MRFLLLLLLLPTVSALKIAATPDKIVLDQYGTGTVQLINPNDEPIMYNVNDEEGELDSNERIRISGKFKGDSLNVKYRSANGMQNILLQPQLSIPLIRMQSSGQTGVFWSVFILIVSLGVMVIYKLI